MTVSPSAGVTRGPGLDTQPGSDASVIERSWDEPEVFAVLFDRYAEDIHRYAARRLGVEAADDLMAEAFAVAFQRRRRYDLSKPQARPWLYGIVSSLIGKHRRAEARRLETLSRVIVMVPAGKRGGGEGAAERGAGQVGAESARDVLAGALAKLPAHYRDVLLLIAWGDLDYTEVAEAMGVPVGTVRSRLDRARCRLREALDGSDPTTLQQEQQEPDYG